MIKSNPEYNKILADALAKADEYKPLITSNNEWISVKDRLPEKVCIYVLVTCILPSGERTVSIDYIPFHGWTIADEEYVLGKCDTKIIAWQPLPAPYKGE